MAVLPGRFEEFPDTLIKFWFSAPLAKAHADWEYIDQHSTNRLLVSLRPAAACSTSSSAEVVVSFAGKPLPGNVSVDLHTSSGATVGTVFAGSPARKAGLVTGDSIIAFGPLKFEDYKSVDESIVPVVKSCVGKPIDVVVVRMEQATAAVQQVALTLTPQKWSGAGLLGCILK